MIIDTEKIRTTIIIHGNLQRSDYRARVISTTRLINWKFGRVLMYENT